MEEEEGEGEEGRPIIDQHHREIAFSLRRPTFATTTVSHRLVERSSLHRGEKVLIPNVKPPRGFSRHIRSRPQQEKKKEKRKKERM